VINLLKMMLNLLLMNGLTHWSCYSHNGGSSFRDASSQYFEF